MATRTNSQFMMASLTEFISVWAVGGKASLSLTTSGGSATVAFNCTLGPPGAPHILPPLSAPFPPPPSPPRRPRHRGPAEKEKNRQRAARHQADLARTAAPASSTPSGEASVAASMTAASLMSTDTVAPTMLATSAVSDPSSETESSDKSVEGSSINFKCDQCTYTNVSKKGLDQHIRMKHMISQVDGIMDSDEETNEEINPFGPLGTENHPSFSSQAEEFTFWKKRAANIEAEMKRLNYSVP